MLGVNNRDLKTFNVSLETSKVLSNLIPDQIHRLDIFHNIQTEVVSNPYSKVPNNRDVLIKGGEV